MAYFPESYAGDIWNKALGNIAGQIGQSIEFYKKRHDELTAMDTELSALAGQPGIDGKPIIDPKAYERIAAHTDKERFGVEKGLIQAAEFQQGLIKAKATYDKATRIEPEFVNDPVSGERFYRTGRGGVSPIKTATRDDLANATNKYATGLGLEPQEFQAIDPNKLQLIDQFGKPIDPKSPLPPVAAIGEVNGKQFRIPAKDIPRFKNMIAAARQHGRAQVQVGRAQGTTPLAPPQAGQVVKGYRFKGGDPSQKDNWEKVGAVPQYRVRPEETDQGNNAGDE